MARKNQELDALGFFAFSVGLYSSQRPSERCPEGQIGSVLIFGNPMAHLDRPKKPEGRVLTTTAFPRRMWGNLKAREHEPALFAPPIGAKLNAKEPFWHVPGQYRKPNGPLGSPKEVSQRQGTYHQEHS